MMFSICRSRLKSLLFQTKSKAKRRILQALAETGYGRAWHGTDGSRHFRGGNQVSTLIFVKLISFNSSISKYLWVVLIKGIRQYWRNPISKEQMLYNQLLKI